MNSVWGQSCEFSFNHLIYSNLCSSWNILSSQSVILFCSWFLSGFFLVWNWFPHNLKTFGLWFTQFVVENFFLENLNILLFSLSFTTIELLLYKDHFHKNWASEFTFSRRRNGHSEKLFDSSKITELFSGKVKA